MDVYREGIFSLQSALETTEKLAEREQRAERAPGRIDDIPSRAERGPCRVRRSR